MRPNPTTTIKYKAVYSMAMLLLFVGMAQGVFLIKDSPAFGNAALMTYLKRPFYSIAFAAPSVSSTASAIRGLGTVSYNPEQSVSSLPILVYHGVLPSTDGSEVNTTEDIFQEHMLALKRAGYETVTLDELEAFLRGETAGLPKKPLLITFDDGRADSFYGADPILAAADYSAVMFAITKLSGEAKRGGYYLSPEELQFMERTGRWDVQSHSHDGHTNHLIDQQSGTMGHFFSNYLWNADAQRLETETEFRNRIHNDFATSQKYLQDLLGNRIDAFAFPFGDLGQNQKDAVEKTDAIVEEAGDVYDLLFYQFRPGYYYTQAYPHSYENGADSVLLRRIDVAGNWSGRELIEVLAHGTSKPLPYYDSFGTNRGWVSAWGTFTIQDGRMHMKASPEQTGGAAILDGSALWEDYTLSIEARSPQRTGVLLWTRFQDEDNNAACNFGINFVHIEQIVDGEKRVIKGVRTDTGIPEGEFTASATVKGRTVSCAINGETLVETDFLNPTLQRGGIGLKIWDATRGKSELYITQLSVESLNSKK